MEWILSVADEHGDHFSTFHEQSLVCSISLLFVGMALNGLLYDGVPLRNYSHAD